MGQFPRAQRLAELGPTIFSEMTELAVATGSINLGQGFPDTSGPAVVLDAARSAVADGANQYAPSRGLFELREAIAQHQGRYYDLAVDPDTEILVTNGATEALALGLVALVDPGDEVICLDPSYDAYRALILLAGARPVHVALDPVTFALNPEVLAAAMTSRTRAIIVNSPHNPTGTIMDEATADAICAAAMDHDLIVFSDEVYEHLCFDAVHVPLATRPDMAQRTITLSSAGKTFAVTGWKIGWATGPAPLIGALALAKTYASFSTAAPLQVGVAAGLRDDAAVTSLCGPLQAQRDLLVSALRTVGFDVTMPQATYFAHSDLGPFASTSAMEFARSLPSDAGVVVIPLRAFCDESTLARHPALDQRVRWAFSKQPFVLTEAIQRIKRAAPRR